MSVTRAIVVIAVLTAAGACGRDPSTATKTGGTSDSVIALAAGAAHTCALVSTATAFCWGENQLGELGDGTKVNQASPVAVHGQGLAALVAGGNNTCALTGNGSAFCWGSNFFGQLGIGSLSAGSGAGPESCLNYDGGNDACSATPLAVKGGWSFTALSIQGDPCGLTRAGAVYCWGRNDLGQLADGSTSSSQEPVRRWGDYTSVPVPVSGGLTFTALASSSGSYGTTCALAAGGAAYCWGNNYSGQLGTGSSTGPQLCNPGSPTDFPCSTAPVAVSGGLKFTALAVSVAYACGLGDGGKAYCWGYNGLGELGDGTTSSSSTPVAVSGGLSFSSLATGVGHACGLTSAGVAYCWGMNRDGQLGTGSATGPALCNGSACSLTPVTVAGGLSFITLVAGASHTCGLTNAGAVYCWGDNTFGQLGDGTNTTRFLPSLVAFR